MAETERVPQHDEEVRLYGAEGIGRILVNPDVIARIAGMAVSEVEGVSLGQKSWVADYLPGKDVVRGINVTRDDESGHYSLTLSVKMAYGSNMRETAETLQRHVKAAVERMAGLELQTIDVRIVDIFIAPDPKDEEEE